MTLASTSWLPGSGCPSLPKHLYLSSAETWPLMPHLHIASWVADAHGWSPKLHLLNEVSPTRSLSFTLLRYEYVTNHDSRCGCKQPGAVDFTVQKLTSGPEERNWDGQHGKCIAGGIFKGINEFLRIYCVEKLLFPDNYCLCNHLSEGNEVKPAQASGQHRILSLCAKRRSCHAQKAANTQQFLRFWMIITSHACTHTKEPATPLAKLQTDYR